MICTEILLNSYSNDLVHMISLGLNAQAAVKSCWSVRPLTKVFLITWIFVFAFTSSSKIDDPVLPSNYDSQPSPYLEPPGARWRKIPRHVWINIGTVKTYVPSMGKLPNHIERLIAREKRSNWTIHMESDTAQIEFMNKHFANTSTLWAFNLINPRLGVAASDIWRYCILLLFGGVYLDDDSFIQTDFETMVRANDSIILTKEPGAYIDECYRDSYPLSYASLSLLNPTSKDRVHQIHGGRTISNWAIFSEPKHPFLRRALENLVDLVRLEYLRQSALKLPYFAFRWKCVMCVTGPAMLTISIKQMMLDSNVTYSGVRIEKRDFGEFGGSFKLGRENGTERGTAHWMQKMQSNSLLLLSSYMPLPHSALEGKLLTSEKKIGASSFEYFLLQNGSLRIFTDVRHLSNYGFTERAALVLDTAFLNSLPRGPKADAEIDLNEGIARLESKLVTLINRRSKRTYFLVMNGSTHRFVNWEHFKSFNFSEESAVPISEAFFNRIPSAAFYNASTTKALDGKMITINKGYHYYSNGSYCSFKDYDHFIGSPLSRLGRSAVPVTRKMLSELQPGGYCS